MNSLSARVSLPPSRTQLTSLLKVFSYVSRPCDSLLHAGRAENFLFSIPPFFWPEFPSFIIPSPLAILLSNLLSLTQHSSSEFPRNMNHVLRIIKSGPGCGPTSLKNRGQWTEMFLPDLLFITTSFVWSFPPPFIFLHAQHFCMFDILQIVSLGRVSVSPATTRLISTASPKNVSNTPDIKQAEMCTSLRRGESVTGSGCNSERVLGENPAATSCLYLHYHIHQGCFKPWFLSSVISPTTFSPVLESDLSVFLRCFLTFPY